jgi:K+-transporting ATPase ATPase A chain
MATSVVCRPSVRERSASPTLFLVLQGVPQTLDGTVGVTTLEGGRQLIARGPVASQIAIKI